MSDFDDTFPKAIMGFCAGMIFLCFGGCVMSIRQAAKDRESCESHGDVYHQVYKSEDLCLNRDDVIPMRELADAKEAEENKPRVVKYKQRFQ